PEGRLEFAGKVGTGFTAKVLDDLYRKVRAREQRESPFTQAKIPGITRAHWVKPDLVGEVAFTEWTSDGRLRHPSFQGLRADKNPKDVVREQPRAVAEVAPPPAKRPAGSRSPEGEKLGTKRGPKAGGEEQVAGVRLTHPNRVLYPPQGITKHDLALFYESIADWILPHLKGRPTALVRCPEGVDGACFYQKHAGFGVPDAIRRVHIKERTKSGEYLVVDTLPALISLAQLGILEIHTWNSTAEDLEHPNRVVFDLDPAPDVPWPRVIEAARLVRDRLKSVKLESFVKTTG